MNAVTAQDQQNDRSWLFALLSVVSFIAARIVTAWQLIISSDTAYFWLAAPFVAIGLYIVSRLIQPTSVRFGTFRDLSATFAWIIALMPVVMCLYFIAMLFILFRS